MSSMTISRDGLELGPLVIPDRCEGAEGLWLGEGTARPRFEPRHDYAPDSAWVGGKQLLGVVKEQGAVAAVVYARGADAAALEALKQELEDALWQFTYTVTFDDGAPRSYLADPAVPDWGEIVPAHQSLVVARCVVTIPVNP